MHFDAVLPAIVPVCRKVKIQIVLIQPAKRISGSIRVPGDKSISHRAAMIAAFADGASRITNYSTSADCTATLSCLRQLGVRIEQAGNDLNVYGVGPDGFRAPAAPLDCGNSGTTMRLLAGILAGCDFQSVLTGDESLRSRPMQRIIEPLQMMGAEISSHDGHAPLIICGRKNLKAIDYELLVASAQVKSCILLAGLNAEGETMVIENEATRDHTERMLKWFGANIKTGRPFRERANTRFAAVTGPTKLMAHDISIPGDISSAAFFIAAATLLPGSSLEISEVGLNRTRTGFMAVLNAVGLMEDIEVTERANETVGTVQVTGLPQLLPLPDQLGSPLSLSGTIISQLIDELPLLALVGSQIEGGVEIRDAKELRVKESDRISTTVENLRAMGAEVQEFDDGLRVNGPAKLRGARIDPHGDHRIAMAFAVAGLLAEGQTEIAGAECVAVSFPEFFELLESVIER
jgi:3-phosphoshikimate 1-carboxyvinyltransferase